MVRVLFIDNTKRAEIKAAIERAAAKPLSLEFVRAGAVDPPKGTLLLSDRKPEFARPESELVHIPRGYSAAFSVEHQPAGLCNHLSVSVDNPKRMPSPTAVSMIAAEYGIDMSDPAKVMLWPEEFAPGHFAINVVALRKVTP